MTTETARPRGIVAMAIVAVIAGVMDVAAGLGNIGFGGGLLTDLGFLETLDSVTTAVGAVLVAVGILGIVTGYGLWQGQGWGWQIARLWASLCIVAGLVGAGLSLFGGTLISHILAVAVGAAVPGVLAAVVLWYLYQPHVKAAFGRA